MGLDMYLDKHVYVGAEYKHRKVSGTISIKSGNEDIPVNFNKVSYIVERVGYWRKANAIHSWIVNNVQDGNDDCNPHYFSEEDMHSLLENCKIILNSTKLVPGKIKDGWTIENGEQKDNIEDGLVLENSMMAEELLPTQSGFFFGSMGYDEYYWQDLLDTVSILEDCLKDSSAEYYYHSSW